jgi:hypothetical protein
VVEWTQYPPLRPQIKVIRELIVLNVLIACEFSGRVTKAFQDKGHNAWSCDIIPTEMSNINHIQGDAIVVMNSFHWDMMIAFPPCRYLARSGARWWKDRQQEQQDAIKFFIALVNADIPKIAIENPIGKISSVYRKPDQVIQPWEHGHGETKSTCLWLKGLPKLKPSNIVSGRSNRIHWMGESKKRSRLRSLTYTGIAKCMADTWG